MNNNMTDLTGKRFGLLTVLELDIDRMNYDKERQHLKIIKRAKIYWKCKCDCGKIISVESSALKQRQQSCGCYKIEKTIEYNKLNKIKYNEYEEFDTYYKCWDTKHKYYFLISKEDYEEVSKYCWHKFGNYWTYSATNKIVWLHQLIASNMDKEYKPSKNYIIDHINNSLTERKEDDNRRCNLRITNKRENSKNRVTQKNNTSGKQGVNWHKKDLKWVARICDNNGKRLYKQFDTFEEAVEQRLEWEKEFGYIGE